MTPELTQKVKILRYRNTSELLALAWVGGARCRVVGPGDGVVRVCAGGGTDESEQLADDAGVAHRPSGSGLQRAGGHCCIEPKGVLARVQSSKAGSTIPVENHDKRPSEPCRGLLARQMRPARVGRPLNATVPRHTLTSSRRYNKPHSTRPDMRSSAIQGGRRQVPETT
jgi:hypothetical protein